MMNLDQRSVRDRLDADDRWCPSPLVLACIWLALVAIAVVGRICQPSWNDEPLWNVTPLAAVALAAGFVFPSMLVAASVPLAALVIGNLVLPSYGNLGVAAVVYAASAWPVVLGSLGLLGRGGPRWTAVLGGSLACSLVFFFSTNLAHWLFTADYPRTAAGLAECLVAALPFYRWMPAGDLAWTAIVFGLLSAVRAATGGIVPQGLAPQAVSSRPLD